MRKLNFDYFLEGVTDLLKSSKDFNTFSVTDIPNMTEKEFFTVFLSKCNTKLIVVDSDLQFSGREDEYGDTVSTFTRTTSKFSVEVRSRESEFGQTEGYTGWHNFIVEYGLDTCTHDQSPEAYKLLEALHKHPALGIG